MFIMFELYLVWFSFILTCCYICDIATFHDLPRPSATRNSWQQSAVFEINSVHLATYKTEIVPSIVACGRWLRFSILPIWVPSQYEDWYTNVCWRLTVLQFIIVI